MAKNFNFQTCRICLKHNGCISIFGEHNSVTIADMIMSFADVKKINQNGRYPSLICLYCLKNISKRYEINQQCKNSGNKILNSMNMDSNIRIEYEYDVGNQASYDPYIHDNVNKYFVPNDLNTFKADICDGNVIETEVETVDLNYFNDKVLNIPKEVKAEKKKPKTKKLMKLKIKCNGISKKNGKKLHKCDRCKKSFNTKAIFKTHYITVHSEKKPFQCERCEKSFKTKSLCDTHRRVTHSEDRPFQCKYCEKMFKTKGYMDTHCKTTHSDERPYQCSRCLKAFKTKGMCDTHCKTTHSEERPYTCDMCGKAFKTKGVCENHYKTH